MAGDGKESKVGNKEIDANDPRSPYFLSSSDNPGNIISPIILDGENYVNWSRVVTNALKSKNKFVFVNGDISRPDDNSPDVHAWERCNSMVIAWLYNVIDKNLHGSVAYAETADEIWKDLKERYSQGNEIRIHQLKREITLTTQGNMSVSDYFTKLKTLWDELGTYLQLPTCKCVKEFNLNRLQESEKIHQLLMGLDTEKYGTLRSNVLSMEPLPNMNKVYAALLREERQQQLSKGTDPRPFSEGAALKVTA